MLIANRISSYGTPYLRRVKYLQYTSRYADGITKEMWPFVDTGVHTSPDLIVECHFHYTYRNIAENNGSTSNMAQHNDTVIGVETYDSNNRLYYTYSIMIRAAGTDISKIDPIFYTENKQVSGNFISTRYGIGNIEPNVVILTKDTTTVNGVTTQNFLPYSGLTLSSQRSLYLFCCNTTEENIGSDQWWTPSNQYGCCKPSSGRVFYVKITNSVTKKVLIEYIPCLDRNMVPCFYDKANDKLVYQGNPNYKT